METLLAIQINLAATMKAQLVLYQLLLRHLGLAMVPVYSLGFLFELSHCETSSPNHH